MASELQLALDKFVQDVEDPELNFELAEVYEKMGNTSSALTHYLRSAERTGNNLLAYEALVRSANCMGVQKDRNFTQSHLLKQAICLLPKRPEAYFFLCRFYEETDQKYECYLMSKIALEICNFTHPLLAPQYGYLGKEGVEFLKAVSGVQWEKNQESYETLNRLRDEAQSAEIRGLCVSNLEVLKSLSDF